jgi:spermidine synthase
LDFPRLHRNRQTLSLTFGTELLQSCMKVDAPAELVLEYTRALMAFMLVHPRPARVLMVGLGGGSIVRYMQAHLPDTHLTVVEISQEVIDLRDEFEIPPDGPTLNVVCADGARYMNQADLPPFDAILIDGFTAEGQPPALATPTFYRACRARLAPDGMLLINLHAAEPALSEHLRRLRKTLGSGVFDLTVEDGDNQVVMAAADPVWQALANSFSTRWAALAKVHQSTLGSSAGRLERALLRRYPARPSE